MRARSALLLFTLACDPAPASIQEKELDSQSPDPTDSGGAGDGADGGTDGADGLDGGDGADGADGGGDTGETGEPVPVSCTLSAQLPGTAAGAAFLLHDPDEIAAEAWGWRRYGLRPVVVDAAEGPWVGSISIEGEGLRVYGEDGALISLPGSIDSAALPVTLLVQGAERGAGQLRLQGISGAEPCGDQLPVDFLTGRSPGLSGHTIDEGVAFDFHRSFANLAPLELHLDPSRWFDRVGQPFNVHLVAHRSPEEWAADPGLGDAWTSGTLSDAEQVWTLLAEVEGPTEEVATGWDLVLDFGLDGQLDPGDLLQGPGGEEAGLWTLASMTSAGPHAVETTDVSGGTWLGERIYYPADIASLGEVPLVAISHGNGHDYRWYDYLGEHLASWGYVVMSHQNNTGPGIETAANTTMSNTEWFLGNLDEIDGGVLEGHIDVHNIAWIGHSRGGESVVYAAHKIYNGDFEPDNYAFEDLKLISSIAPTVFMGTGRATPHDRPYHLLAGAADGDVTGGADCDICQFKRIAEAAEGPVAVTYVQGASHNDFNCCGFADGTGPDLIGREEAQEVALGVWLPLIEWRLRGNEATRELVTRPFEEFLPEGVEADTRVSNQWSDPTIDRLVLDDFEDGDEDTAVASNGGAVTSTLEDMEEGILNDGDTQFEWRSSDPMNGMTLSTGASEDTRGLVFGWEEEGSWALALPADQQDWLPYTSISLRFCQQTRHSNTRSWDDLIGFSITLIDADGVEVSLPLRANAEAESPYGRTGLGGGSGWANEWQTARLRLLDFEAGGTGIDLSRIATLRLDFGGDYGGGPGRAGLDDIELIAEDP